MPTVEMILQMKSNKWKPTNKQLGQFKRMGELNTIFFGRWKPKESVVKQ